MRLKFPASPHPPMVWGLFIGSVVVGRRGEAGLCGSRPNTGHTLTFLLLLPGLLLLWHSMKTWGSFPFWEKAS